MNNNLKKRISWLLAMLIIMMSFTSCNTSTAPIGAGAGHTVTAADVKESDKDSSAELAAIQAQIDSLSKSLSDAKTSLEEYQTSIKELETENKALKAKADESAKALEKANAEMLKQTEEGAKTLNSVKAEKATLEAEKATWDAEKAALEARIAALEANVDPEVEVIGDKIYADLNYVLEDIIFIFEDNTAALKATTKGNPVYVTSREVIGSQTAYPKNTVMLPREGYNYAVTYDCVNVYAVGTAGNNQSYSYANGGLFLGAKLTTGYQLKDTTLRGSFGLTDDLLEAVIVAVEDPSAEYGYSFFVRVGNYAANPVYEPSCKHGTGCHCGNCDACPALEPETIIETQYVDREVIKEVEVVKEVHCKKCGHKEGPCPAGCTCECCPDPEKEIVTVTETEYVYIPIYVPVTDDSDDGPAHNERPEIPDITQDPEDPSNDVNQPAHNDRPEAPDITQNPEDPTNDGNKPAHNDRDDVVAGDLTQTPDDPKNDINAGHNDREDITGGTGSDITVDNSIPDLTRNPEDSKNDVNAGHNDRTDITGGNSNSDITGIDNVHSARSGEVSSDTNTPLHSPRE